MRALLAVLLAAAVAGCGTPRPVTRYPTRRNSLRERTHVYTVGLDSEVVWNLKQGLRDGGSLVVLRYEDRNLKILSRCAAEGTYAKEPAPSSEIISEQARTEAEIAASAGRGAVQLRRDAKFNVTYIPIQRVRLATEVKAELSGDCNGATHIVTGAQLGGAIAYWGKAIELGGGGGINLVSVRARLEREDRFELMRGVDEDTGKPDPALAAVVRLNLVAIDLDHRKAVNRAKASRAVGATALGLGLASAALSVTFLGLGARRESQIEAGVDPTRRAGLDDQGGRFNRAALGTGIAGAVLGLAGAALLYGGTRDLKKLEGGR